MKIIHTADWHVGNIFHSHDRTEEHRHFMTWLLKILQTEQPDALIVSGDLFDNANPGAGSQTLLYDFLEAATSENIGLQIILLAGNHDSATRLEAPAALLRRHGIYALGTVPRNEKGAPDYESLCLPLYSRTCKDERIYCLAVPFLRTTDCPRAETAGEGVRLFLAEALKSIRRKTVGTPLIVAAHFYAAGADIVTDEHSERLIIGGQECVDASPLADGPAYVALGHIHKAQRVAGNEHIRYAGSILPMSFSEKHYRHGVLCIEIQPTGDTTVTQLPYEPQRRLMSIPEQGACTISEAMDAIDRLPKAGKHDDGRCWPYLEIKISEERPDPALARQILSALEGKAVRFCRLERISQITEKNDEKIIPSLESLRRMTPLEMARLVFRNRYGKDLPDDLACLFEKACKQAENPESETTDQ